MSRGRPLTWGALGIVAAVAGLLSVLVWVIATGGGALVPAPPWVALLILLALAGGVLVVARPGASLWARFYDLEQQHPLFVDRDSQPVAFAQLPNERRTGYSWYGGHYPAGSNASSYQLFSAMGQDVIVLNLVCTPALLADATDWANAVLTQYADRNAIVVTHGYIKPNGEYAGGDDVSFHLQRVDLGQQAGRGSLRGRRLSRGSLRSRRLSRGSLRGRCLSRGSLRGRCLSRGSRGGGWRAARGQNQR